MAIVYNETEREQILTGKINAFLRSWPTDVPELPEGSVQTLHVSEKNGPFAVVRIRTTRRLKLTDLTETMARQLGNRSRDEAIKDFLDGKRKTGAAFGTGRLVWFVEFEVIVKPD